ncbi:MAG TPA: AMP-binding protein [Telluria sp.]|nr:AMP-binding protein [Telluria sp.]
MPLTFLEVLARRAQTAPDAAAVSGADARISYQRLWRDVQNAGRNLQDLGVRAGDAVALCLDYRYSALLALLGCWRAGAKVIPLDPNLPPARVRAALADLESAWLIAQPERSIQVQAARGLITPADLRVPRDPGNTAQSRPASDGAVVRLHDGAELTAADVMQCLGSLDGRLRLGPSDCLLTLQPLGYAGGMLPLLGALAGGARIALFNRVFSRDVPDAVVREGATCIAPDPSLLNQLSGLHWPPAPTLRMVVAPPAPLALDTLDALRCQVPGVRLIGAPWSGVPRPEECEAA